LNKNGIVQEHYSILPALSFSPCVSYKPWQMSGLLTHTHTAILEGTNSIGHTW